MRVAIVYLADEEVVAGCIDHVFVHVRELEASAAVSYVPLMKGC